MKTLGDVPMTKEQLMKLLIPNRPWESEPNNVRFRCLGYNCEIKRHDKLLHLCGYINIPRSHPLYDCDEEDGVENFISVHGGITYQDKTSRFRRIGFDCAHVGDFSPGAFMVAAWMFMEDKGEVDLERLHITQNPEGYKTVRWVADQLSAIAMQLKTYEIKYDTEEMMGTLKGALRTGKSPSEELKKYKEKRNGEKA